MSRPAPADTGTREPEVSHEELRRRLQVLQEGTPKPPLAEDLAPPGPRRGTEAASSHKAPAAILAERAASLEVGRRQHGRKRGRDRARRRRRDTDTSSRSSSRSTNEEVHDETRFCVRDGPGLRTHSCGGQ